MSQIKPGHRLYLYRLFRRELGVGKQTALARAAGVLEADGLAPADLGFEDARSLFEELSECVKVTVFKKGAVFVTVLANEEYDQALARAEKNGGKNPAGAKSFKRQRGVKNVKPLKPKHIEPKPEPEPEVEPAQEPEETLVVGPELEPTLAAEANSAAERAIEAQPEAGLEVATPQDAKPGVELTTENEAKADKPLATYPEPAPAPEPAPEPPIKFTITYAPEPIEQDIEPCPSPKAATDEAPIGEPAATEPAHARPSRPARPANNLPQDFYADVIVTDEPLSALYQVLPLEVDPVATLEEDFRIARSTGTLDGTRSEVSFPMRFQRRDGSPVMVTLRRRARAVAGKHWTLASIDADAPEEVGMGALERKAAGPWAAFANKDQLFDAISPEAELAQFAVLGSWDKLLEELSALAAPEDWGEGRALLREYLAMRYRRVARERLVSMADDGSSAAFDTGLLSASGEPIAAILEPHDGDIHWELTCFSLNAQARPATWPQMPEPGQIARELLETGDPALRRAAALVVRSPRAATQAYDAVNDAVYVLAPVDGQAYALGHGPVNKADARVCARVVSADQPVWLDK
ncbi:DUF3825 domain-containing protein [Paratractidigestivibacter sp.]|uniref:DUF3825 domain-containing protein n=1 Tax=Paratractidigestivibacter sp. TaxID=2847316 RepID=UPI003AB8A83A